MPTTSDNSALRIVTLPGDGIGPEVMAPCLEMIDLVADRIDGVDLEIEQLEGGANYYAKTGEALPPDASERIRAADAILLAAIGDPSIRYPDGREIASQVDIREELELFAGLRPILTSPGMRIPLADPRAQNLDVVIIRESTEGFFAGRHSAEVTQDYARETSEITRAASVRVFDHAFTLARRRKAAGKPGVVTCVDKANIFRSFKFFREVFDECASNFPDIEARHLYADAAALNLVKQPWMFDVIVTENLLGDILSDLGAGLMGGLGMAPSGDIGHEHAVFQPCHGTAPDIAGTGKANPTAMFLSTAMMFEWLSERHDRPGLSVAGAVIRNAVRDAYADGRIHPTEIGGRDGLAQITEAIRGELSRALEDAA